MVEFAEEVRSTNTTLMERMQAGEELPHLYTLCTFRQTAGRGQRGNSWESEPDKNISFTTVLDCRQLKPEQLWRLSMLSALAVAEALHSFGIEATIKWPNDIYVGDLKICGMLIENVLQGSHIRCSLSGIGVNVNQEVFVSNAPNPTSMKLITGRTFDKKEVLMRILQEMKRLWPITIAATDELERYYKQRLYRREGRWLWREVPSSEAPMMIDREADDTAFYAQIAGISEQGQLLLKKDDGSIHAYSFKEIKYIISR